MKDKLLSILNKLESEDISDFFYSLTINYNQVIPNYNRVKYNLENIKDSINLYSEIKTYNLTITNVGDYYENSYKKYYHNVYLIFHSDGAVIDFTSNYLINNNLNVGIEQIFDVYREHINCSKRLYDVINKIW